MGNEKEEQIMGTTVLIILVVIVLLALALISQAFVIVQQSNRYVVERLGGYHASLDVGLHFIVPFIDRIKQKVSLKEQVVDFPPQPVITKDNVTMQIDTVVFYMVTDAKLYTYGVDYPIRAIENLTATTLRNIIGDLELDESLTSRDLINEKMRVILDEATDPWGIKINRVEGNKRSAILNAEGAKESAILKADAEKEKRIREAEGRAKAIIEVQPATAAGI